MKNYLIGIGFLLAAFYLLWQQGEVARERSVEEGLWDENQPPEETQSLQQDQPSEELTIEDPKPHADNRGEDAFEVLEKARRAAFSRHGQ